jgi:hypothetical protein
MSNGLLKAVILVPALAASFLVTVLLVAVLFLLAPVAGILSLAAAVTLLVMVASGHLESWLARIVTNSRPVTPAEAQVMAPVRAGLARRGVPAGEFYARRRVTPWTPEATITGPSNIVVITPRMIGAAYRRAISADEVAALITHAIAYHDTTRPRAEMVVIAATLPARGIVAAGAFLFGLLSWLPLFALAIRMRVIVAAGGLAQGFTEGPPGPGIVAAAIIGASYAIPAASRALSRRAEAHADQTLVHMGLGPVFMRLIGRNHKIPLEREMLLAGRLATQTT